MKPRQLNEPRDCELHAIWVADTSWFGRMIGGQGRGFWSHMAIRVAPDAVLDSRMSKMPNPGGQWAKVYGYPDPYIAPGVQFRPLSYLDAYPEYLELVIPCTNSQLTGVYADLKSQRGKPYDKLGILDFARSSAIDRNWREQSAWFCDELDAWALEKRGICRPILSPVYRLTPGVVNGICMQIDGSKIVRWRGTYVGEFMDRALQVRRAQLI